MIQSRGRQRFLLESSETAVIVSDAFRQHFDRDVAIEAGIARAIDLAHPACAKQRKDLVGAEPVPAANNIAGSAGDYSCVDASARTRC